MSTVYDSEEDLAITSDHRCEECGHEFGEGEGDRRREMYEEGSLLGTMGSPDRCPGCWCQLIKWAR